GAASSSVPARAGRFTGIGPDGGAQPRTAGAHDRISVERRVQACVLLYDLDIVPGLGERDALREELFVRVLRKRGPTTHAIGPGVVGCEHGSEAVAVPGEQLRHVPGAQVDVDLGLLEETGPEVTQAYGPSQRLARVGHDLHEADRACGALDRGTEHRLLPDEAGHEERIEPEFLRLRHDQVAVREWVDDPEQARIPGALALVDLPTQPDAG